MARIAFQVGDAAATGENNVKAPAVLIASLLTFSLGALAETANRVVVNGETLTDQEIGQLVSAYGQVYIGNYWYDRVSGLYGTEGKGASGQLHPNLPLRGALSPSASGGGDGSLTGVFINGREIHPEEAAFLKSLFGNVMPGRYWMNAEGVGGYENGPALFDVGQAVRAASGTGTFDSHYLPWIGGQPGTSVGRASDGCIYISQGGYSNDFC